MFKRSVKKLHSRAGESIGETLVAVLISALALLILAGAISAATRVITRSDTAVNEFYTNDAMKRVTRLEMPSKPTSEIVSKLEYTLNLYF